MLCLLLERRPLRQKVSFRQTAQQALFYENWLEYNLSLSSFFDFVPLSEFLGPVTDP